MCARIPEPALQTREYSVEQNELKSSVGYGFIQLVLFNNY